MYNSSAAKYMASYGYQAVNDPLGSVMPSDKYLYNSSSAQQINFNQNNNSTHKSQLNFQNKNIEGSKLDFEHYQKKYSYLYNPEKLSQKPTDQQNYLSRKQSDDIEYKPKLYPTNKVEFSKYFDTQTDRNYYNYMKFKNDNNAYDNFRQESKYLQSSVDQYFKDKQKFSDSIYRPQSVREVPAFNYHSTQLERVPYSQYGHFINNEYPPVDYRYQQQPVQLLNQFDRPIIPQQYQTLPPPYVGPQLQQQYYNPYIQEQQSYQPQNLQKYDTPVYRSQFIQREQPVFNQRVSNQFQRDNNYDSNEFKQSAGELIDYQKKEVSRRASLQEFPYKSQPDYNLQQNNFGNNQIKSNYNDQFLNKSFDYTQNYQQQSNLPLGFYQPYNILQQPPVILQGIQPINQYLPPPYQQQSPLYVQNQVIGEPQTNPAYNKNLNNNNISSPQFPQYFSPQQQSYLLDKDNFKVPEGVDKEQVKYIVKEEESQKNDAKSYLSPLKMNQNQQIKQQSQPQQQQQQQQYQPQQQQQQQQQQQYQPQQQQYQSQQYQYQQQPQQQSVKIQPPLEQKPYQQVKEDQQIQQKQEQILSKQYKLKNHKQTQLQESPIQNQKYFSLGCGQYQCAQYKTSQSHMRQPSSQQQLQELNNEKNEEQVLIEDQNNMETKEKQKQEENKAQAQGVKKPDNLFQGYYVYQPIFTNKPSYNGIEPLNTTKEQQDQNQYEFQSQQPQPVQQVIFQQPPQAQIVQQLVPVTQQPPYLSLQDLKLSNQPYIQNPEQFVISSTPYPYQGPFQSQFIQNQPVATLIPVTSPEYIVGSNSVVLPQQGGQYILQQVQPQPKVVQQNQQKSSFQQNNFKNNYNDGNSYYNNDNFSQQRSNKQKIFEGYDKQPSQSQKLKNSLQNFNNMQFSSPYVIQDNRQLQQQQRFQSKQQYQ